MAKHAADSTTHEAPKHQSAPEHTTLRAALIAQFDRWGLLAAVIIDELILKASTTGNFFPSLIFIALFSLSFVALIHALLQLIPRRRTRRVVVGVIMLVLALSFGIEYFVFREFKVFYDLRTVTRGAADVAEGFGDEIRALVFSGSGMLRIGAFLAPVVSWSVYCYKSWNTNLPEQSKRQHYLELGGAGLVSLLCYIAALLSIQVLGYRANYSTQYSFQTATPNFGLITSARKDIQNSLSGASRLNANAHHELSPREQTDFEPSVMDIDFEALAQNASGRYAELDRYVSSLTPSSKNKMTGLFEGYNLIMISAEAFSAEAIREDTTPTLWRMAHNGIQFTDYYQFDSAGTTGGECGNIFGLMPTEGGSSVKNTSSYNNYLTMGNTLNRLGYNGWAFHNNTYTYYDRHLTHNNLGYNNGFMGYGNGMEAWVDWVWPESDLQMVQGTFDNIYGDMEPFNVYYMSVSGHSGYTPAENAMAEKNWDVVKDLDYSEPVKGYLAANVELDRAMEYLIDRLEEKGMADHTVIVISADHFPYGLDDDGPLGSLPYTSELYGYDVDTYFERDHNRLIIWSGSLEPPKEAADDEDDAPKLILEDEEEAWEPIVVDSPTFAIDILPTLLNLFGCDWDSRLLPGRDVFSDAHPLVFDLNYDWKTELGTYYAGSGSFVPAQTEDDEGNLVDVEVPEGYVERVNSVVSNKIEYCKGVLQTDYFRHVFGDPEDVEMIHATAQLARNAQDLVSSSEHEDDESNLDNPS